ncbi:hypothetical protein ACFLTX_03645 [Chloroflexota bacterium]
MLVKAKEVIRGLKVQDCKVLVGEVLKLGSADEVKALVKKKMPGIPKT